MAPVLLVLLALLSVHIEFARAVNGVCGAGTTLDGPDCVCSSEVATGNVYIAGLLDTAATAGYGSEMEKHFNLTAQLINDHTDGFWDGVLSGTTLEVATANSGCSSALAGPAYWDKRRNWGRPLHGVVGGRCSGASMAVARIAALEQVLQVSPSATSAKLNDRSEFPYFYRTAAPDDATGEVGATLAALRHFGWDRVTILHTDTVWASGAATEFSGLWVGSHAATGGDVEWTGQIAHTSSIKKIGDAVDPDSVRQALAAVPTGDPASNSRVVLLFAHNDDAYPILKIVHESGFQPDTIWFGTSSWTTEMPADPSFLPDIPGYIGLIPYVNTAQLAQDYLIKLNAFELTNDLSISAHISKFGGETADALVALAMVMHELPSADRTNGTKIKAAMASLSFTGVSGTVEFTALGSRKNPQYTVMHMKDPSGWTTLGSVGLTLNSASNINDAAICWAVAGCGAAIPSDKYPVPPPRVITNTESEFPVWAIFLLLAGGLALSGLAFKYWRSKVGKNRTRHKLTKLQKEMEEVKKMKGMWTIVKALPSRSLARTASTGPMLEERGISEDTPLTQGGQSSPPQKIHYDVTWYWEEDSNQMGNHQPQMTLADEGLNFVEYSHGVNNELEDAYQLFSKGQGSSTYDLDLENKISTTGTEMKAHHAHTGCLFELNFDDMKQVNKKSQFGRTVMRRKIERAFQPLSVDHDIIIEMDEVMDLPPLPAGIDFRGNPEEDIEPEHILAARPGQIIQVSREHDDNIWLYGSIIIDAKGASKSSETTGWFPKTIAKVAGPKELEQIAKLMGGGAGDVLKPPARWTHPEDPQLQVIDVVDSVEFQAVKDAFMATLSRYPSIKVLKIERIQNLTMWQSYAVKRQQILMRDKGRDGANWRVNNKGELERKWMFHGTSMDTVPKIQSQGFNRAFAGKNAVAYGKGVYFARDSRYSCSTTYSRPDDSGVQRMFACRVAAGDWCYGRNGQLTPDVKSGNDLFDCTVDNISDPSIVVVYHDAQAYPEYMIHFTQH